MRLRIRAADVSISHGAADDSSILNILPATIESIDDAVAGTVLLTLVSGETRLLARITVKSLRERGYAEGSRVFAQVKSVAVERPAIEPVRA